MAATRAQKIRLAVFLIVTTAIVVATMFYLVGASMLQVRDEYIVILEGSSGGLETGSQVRLNDIVVGRVESVKLDPDDPGIVKVVVSLEHGTPVTVDTVATPEMANITGTKRLAMHGGTKDSKRLQPGDTIASADSDLSMLATKVVNISNKLEELLDHLNEATEAANLEKFSNILTEVEGVTSNLNKIVGDNRENVELMVADARNVLAHVDQSLSRVDHALGTAESAIRNLASQHNVKQVSTILDDVHGLMDNVTRRTSDEELGTTIASVNRLVTDTNVTILSLRVDLQRVLRELETSVENINEFSQILVENPSVLISGRREKERQLP